MPPAIWSAVCSRSCNLTTVCMHIGLCSSGAWIALCMCVYIYIYIFWSYNLATVCMHIGLCSSGAWIALYMCVHICIYIFWSYNVPAACTYAALCVCESNVYVPFIDVDACILQNKPEKWVSEKHLGSAVWLCGEMCFSMSTCKYNQTRNEALLWFMDAPN